MGTAGALRCLALVWVAVHLARTQQAFEGRCTCDVTAGKCDVHCCCDPDCQQDGLSGLVQTFDCLPDGRDELALRQCYSRSWLNSVNPRTDLSVLEDDLRGLFCVVVDNNPVTGVYYTNQPRVPVADLDTAITQHAGPTFSFPVPGSTSDRGYQPGDVLVVHRALSGNTKTLQLINKPADLRTSNVLEVASPLALWLPDAFGTCSTDRGQPARFMEDVRQVSCWLPLPDLEDACTKELDPRRHISWMLRKRQLSAQSRCGVDRCLAPNTTASCPLSLVDQNGSTTVTECPPGQGPTLSAPIFEGNGSDVCRCKNALREVHYTFRYASAPGAGSANEMVITGAELRLVLQDVESRSCGPLRAYQASSVRFLPERPTHPRSGNPGYRTGAPLLVARCRQNGYDATTGRCVEWEDAHSQMVATVPGVLPDGTCAQVGGPPGRPIEMNFGENALFGCMLELTRQELQELCVQGDDNSGFVGLLPLLRFGRSGNQWTHIAAFGDVPPGSQSSDSWVKVEVAEATEVLEFSDGDVNAANLASDASCRGGVVGVDLEIVFSPFGKVGAPQSGIVGARAKHRQGTLTFTRLDPTVRQSFPFTFTVTFARLDTTPPEIRVPPRPRLPLSLPHDLFYPFRLSSATQDTRAVAAAMVFAFVALIFR